MQNNTNITTTPSRLERIKCFFSRKARRKRVQLIAQRIMQDVQEIPGWYASKHSLISLPFNITSLLFLIINAKLNYRDGPGSDLSNIPRVHITHI
jgi:hypothetical protein